MEETSSQEVVADNDNLEPSETGAGEETKQNPKRSLRHRKAKRTQASRAGLLFPVARIHRYLKNRRQNMSRRISSTSAIYLAATLEYLVAEVLAVGFEATMRKNKNIVTPQFINLGVRDDAELHVLLKNVTISGGGVQPGILAPLLPKGKNRGARRR